MRYLKYFENREHLTLCDVDIDWVRDHFDTSFGNFEDHLDPDRGGIDLSISRCLKLDGDIIGCYCMQEFSIIECIDRLKSWAGIGGDVEDSDILYNNLEFFIDEKKLKRIFKKKVGIFGDYLFIDVPYRNNRYADVLIDYSKTLGDYNWGITSRGKPENFWINKNHREKICEFVNVNDKRIGIVNSTLPR